VARKVSERLDAILAPAVPFGMCFDQRHFKGTIALKPSTYAYLLKEICSNFIRDGYRLVLAISGHRGNDHAAISGLQEAAWDSETHVLYMCYQDANKGGSLCARFGEDGQAHEAGSWTDGLVALVSVQARAQHRGDGTHRRLFRRSGNNLSPAW
jgi:creatinine amidohydrolase/Fe(II)-dependent formamide hydrolase-like protein